MKYWLAVISLEHAKIAAGSGFLQVCHGKAAPLHRTSAGDKFFIYSPKTGMGEGKSIKSITYHGAFDDNEVCQVEQFPGFKPFRKDVTFDKNFTPVPIMSITNMDLTNTPNWGLIIRRGFVELSIQRCKADHACSWEDFMNKPPIIVVVFDAITKNEFFRRLDWPYLVRAWSKAISWKAISHYTIRLDLKGVDGLQSIFVTRRFRGNKVFIGARDARRNLIQTGVWEWDEIDQLAVCYRRVYKPELVEVLRERLPDFCLNIFLIEKN